MDDEWMRHAERRFAALETRTAVDEVHRTAVERRLSRIEETLRWLVRVVIGALIVGLIAYTIKGGIAVT